MQSQGRESGTKQNQTNDGRDRINYPDDCSQTIAQQHHINTNSTIYDMDIKTFYFIVPLKHYEYLQLKLVDIPKDVKKHYKLSEKAMQDG